METVMNTNQYKQNKTNGVKRCRVYCKFSRWLLGNSKMKVKVYTKCIKLNYFNTFFSKATHLVFILNVIAYVAPFFIAYASKGFWLRRTTFYEQPDVKYKYEYIFIAETNKFDRPIFCSNIFDIDNDIVENLDFCDEVLVREIDYNEDGKMDELNFTISIDNLEDLRISGVTLILPMEYNLFTECYVKMDTIGLIQNSYSNPGTKITIYGDLILNQRDTIPCSKNTIFDLYKKSGINENFNDLNNLFTEEYFTRNISTKIDTNYIIWKSGINSNFELNLLMKIPVHKIYYSPNFWQVVKFAWVQYLAIYILFAWFVKRFKEYIFTNRFVSYYIDSTSYYNNLKNKMD